ncbi:hypothetical protein WDU94_010832 [Cyamophila willieti]
MDELRESEMPEGCEIQAYADDVTVVVCGRSRRQIEERATAAMEVVQAWLTASRIQLSVSSAKAEDLNQKLLASLSEADIPLSKILMVSCDGPNVNKKVLRLLNETLLEVRAKGLLDVGTCTLHSFLDPCHMLKLVRNTIELMDLRSGNCIPLEQACQTGGPPGLIVRPAASTRV